ncbi:Uncharacterised protein [Leclercia adecarboxylata]|uniref:Uncharacterized protein n=1 Tax=Leclercia adecarboxylata TaxID=83655 RepID=A0A4U9I063_9ENTR|nr:Uncharacterised protein [Leclercia adecarboxylata]
MIKVAQPIASAVAMMFTCRNASPTAYRHCIKAGGDRRGDQQPEAVTLNRLVVTDIIANTFDNHTSAEEGQQDKSDPVVPFQHELAGKHPQTPADQRRQGFE